MRRTSRRTCTLKDPAVPIGVNWDSIRARKAATARPRSTRSSSDGDGDAAAADQRAELRALQDLRHQGPRPEHRLDHAAGRRRAELHRRDVICGRGASWRATVRSFVLDPYSHPWLTDWCWSLVYSWKDTARSSRFFISPVRSPASHSALPPGETQNVNLNVLLRGQSNAVVLGTLLAPDGRSAVAEAVERLLGSTASPIRCHMFQ